MRYESIDQLLASVPAGSRERHFFADASDLLKCFPKPATTAEAFALLSVLEMGEIHLRNGNVLGADELTGSIEDWGRLFSIYFKDISDEPLWWKANHPGLLTSSEVKREIPGIKRKIEALPSVLHTRWIA